MDSALAIHRFHFAFTITFHYLFVQLTLGLALLIFILKTMAAQDRRRALQPAPPASGPRSSPSTSPSASSPASPWSFSSAPTGRASPRPPAASSDRPSPWKASTPSSSNPAFLGLLIYGEKLLGRIGHWFASLMVWIGSWLRGYLIVATNAWMQHPVGYALGPNGEIILERLGRRCSSTSGPSGSICTP